MTKILISSILVSLMLVSCTSTEKFTQIKKTNEQPGFDKLDWEGTYVGTEPCADCREIKKKLTLNEDMTYVLEKEYIGSSKPNIEKYSGTFEWGIAGALILNTDKGKNMGVNRYLVAKNLLVPTDKDGHPAIGGESMLTKYKTDLLFDRKWILTELNGKPIVKSDDEAAQEAFLQFETGRVFGNSGCNSLTGEFALTMSNIINFDKVASTRMMCADMKVEDAFLEVLSSDLTYTLEDNELNFLDGGGTNVAKFKAK